MQLYTFFVIKWNMRQVIVYRDEDGYWIVAGYVAALEEDGLPVPEENFETFLVLV
ncbi:MAG: hypothetical protein V7L14_29620 [Nostoc sp.]|uniref:hypothetical protein n=1 Tax=Nostoc sp. TaxID=1180 RepID=UPI002FFBEB80